MRTEGFILVGLLIVAALTSLLLLKGVVTVLMRLPLLATQIVVGASALTFFVWTLSSPDNAQKALYIIHNAERLLEGFSRTIYWISNFVLMKVRG